MGHEWRSRLTATAISTLAVGGADPLSKIPVDPGSPAELQKSLNSTVASQLLLTSIDPWMWDQHTSQNELFQASPGSWCVVLERALTL